MTQETQDIQKTVAAVLDQPAASGPPPTASEPPVMPPAQAEPAPGVGGPPTPGAPKTAAKKRKAKKKVRRIIALVVALALLAGGAFAVWYFLLRKTVEQGELLRDVARIDTIQSKVEGSGNAVAKDMAAITISASGTVQEVYVNQGDVVAQGDLLYTVISPAAQEALTAAQKGVRTAEEEVITAQDGIGEAQDGVLTAQEGVVEAREGVAEAQERVKEAREALAERQEELAKLQGSVAELSTTAPFAGKLISVEDITVGSELSAGSAVATLVNDKVMKLSLYFSYAYENSIYAGQKADVSIPAMMLSCPGTVSAVNKISLVSPEGGILFEAVIDVENPGALTEELSATATLSAADGTDIFPYDEGKLAYSETVKLEAKQTGPVLSKALLKYANVSQGQVLLVQGSDSLDDQIKAKQKEVTAAEKAITEAEKGVTAAEKAVTTAEKGVVSAQKAVEQAYRRVEDAEQGVLDAQAKVEEAQKALDDLNTVSPIDGTVASCTITPGQEVKGGDTVMTISNTAQMSVEIKVTDQNIGFITPGMAVELTNYGDGMWMGIVTKIDMNPSQDNMGSGVTNYPVTLTVDNYDNSLLPGQWLQYSFVASQADNCLVVPNQAVKSTMDEEGNELTVVFIEAESRPENAVTMPEQSPDMPKKYPTEEEGFYAVPVTTGLSDTYNVEIRSGLNEGDTVFTNYLSASGDSWGMYG